MSSPLGRRTRSRTSATDDVAPLSPRASSRSKSPAGSPRRKSIKEEVVESSTTRGKTPFVTTARAYLVHAYTASTAILQLLCAHQILNEQYNSALVSNMACVLIDATDGFLARRWNVKKYAAAVDGRRLDDIIDYITFVFLPVLFMMKTRMLLEPFLLYGSLPLLSSAFGFSRVLAKMDDDGFFVGFPSYWNIVVLWLYLFESSPQTNTIIIACLALMIFLPTRYIYITRFQRHRFLHYTGSYLMGTMMVGALLIPAENHTLRRELLLLSLIYPIFYTAHSFWCEYQARIATAAK